MMHAEGKTLTALLEIDLDAIAANWRALDAMHAGEDRGRGQGRRLRAGGRAVAPNLLASRLPAFLHGPSVRGAGDPRAAARCDAGGAERASARRGGGIFARRPRPRVLASLAELERLARRSARGGAADAAGDPACRYRHGPARISPRRAGAIARRCHAAGGDRGQHPDDAIWSAAEMPEARCNARQPPALRRRCAASSPARKPASPTPPACFWARVSAPTSPAPAPLSTASTPTPAGRQTRCARWSA